MPLSSLKAVAIWRFGSGFSSGGAGFVSSLVAMAFATAVPWVRLRDMGMSMMPASRATSSARLCSTATGLPRKSCETSTSAKPIPPEKPVPSALTTASLAAKWVAKCTAGLCFERQ